VSPIGLGDSNGESAQAGRAPFFKVYIANRPPLDEYQNLEYVKPLLNEEIAYIAKSTGNHWRKIFNVYAKFIFSFQQSKKIAKLNTWQNYRDQCLLQEASHLQLLFTPPKLTGSLEQEDAPKNTCHIIMGKQYAIELGFHENDHQGMIRLDNDFVIWPEKNMIVCPYFDYRQLSNIKIEKLIVLINQMFPNPKGSQ